MHVLAIGFQHVVILLILLNNLGDKKQNIVAAITFVKVGLFVSKYLKPHNCLGTLQKTD